MYNSNDVGRRAARVKLLLMDCDGVLTDGRITLIGDGDEQKSFNVRDGHGLVLLHRAGLGSGIISGRRSGIVERRARELGVAYVRQGIEDKIAAFHEILADAGIGADESAYVGDDLTDLPLMRRCGLAVAVADAGEEVRSAAHLTTAARGGYGAVREVCELILKAQGRWAEVVRQFVES